MPRVFVAIDLPDDIDEQLELVRGGIPGARWEERDKLHLTLRFLGEVDGGTLRSIKSALEQVIVEPFNLILTGVGHFPPRGMPRNLWVGVVASEQLRTLKARIDRAVSRVGLPPDNRKFAPHVTVARLRDAPHEWLASYIASHSLLRLPPFLVDRFQLFSSVRSERGSKYRVEQEFR